MQLSRIGVEERQEASTADGFTRGFAEISKNDPRLLNPLPGTASPFFPISPSRPYTSPMESQGNQNHALTFDLPCHISIKLRMDSTH
jgi:hypothetical protein